MLNSLSIINNDGEALFRAEFHPGMNRIEPENVFIDGLNENQAATVLMLAVDYAFGGSDYADRKYNPAIRALGEHRVEFSFMGNGDPIHYYRRTDEEKYVYRFYPGSGITERIGIRKYQKGLLEMYGFGTPRANLQFYDIVGRFFRIDIDGRDTLKQGEPLHRIERERSRTPIAVLNELFEVPQELIQKREEQDRILREKEVFAEAMGYGMIHVSDDKSEVRLGLAKPVWKNNEVYGRSEEDEPHVIEEPVSFEEKLFTSEEQVNEIEELSKEEQRKYGMIRARNEDRKKEILGEKDKLIRAMDNEITRKLDDADKETVSIKRKLANLYRRKMDFESKLRAIEENLAGLSGVEEDDLERIRVFFPEADLQQLGDVDAFHKEISVLLRSEIQEEMTRIQERLAEINQEISRYTNSIQEAKEYVNFSGQALRDYESVVEASAMIEEQGRSIGRGTEISDRLDQVSHSLFALQTEYYEKICREINNEMREILAPGDNQIGWRLEVSKNGDGYQFYYDKPNSYQNYYAGMIAFDLSLLKLTNLPAVIHDTSRYGRYLVGTEEWARLLRAYEHCCKQAFVYIT